MTGHPQGRCELPFPPLFFQSFVDPVSSLFQQATLNLLPLKGKPERDEITSTRPHLTGHSCPNCTQPDEPSSLADHPTTSQPLHAYVSRGRHPHHEPKRSMDRRRAQEAPAADPSLWISQRPIRLPVLLRSRHRLHDQCRSRLGWVLPHWRTRCSLPDANELCAV